MPFLILNISYRLYHHLRLIVAIVKDAFMFNFAYIVTQLLSIFAGLLGISFIVVFHEFGHYLFCKLFKVHTPTFSIGIGKILYSKKIGDTNFCISAGPIGGYVEVSSEQGENGSLGFNQIPYYQKVLIMLGGIGFNFILSYLIFVGLFFSGMPENAAGPYEPATTKIAQVIPGSLNEAVLQPGDEIVSLDHHPLNADMTRARKIIAAHVDANLIQIHAQIARAGLTQEVELNLKGKCIAPAFGKQLEISMQTKPGLSLGKSITMASQALMFYLHAIIASLKDVVQAKTVKGFVGPLMAVAASSKSVQKGAASLFFLLAIISLNLGFMNLLPLPIFDGGQFVIFTTEALLRRQLSEQVRHWIGISSWVLAIGLLVIFTIRDFYVLIWH
jgi:regulator of sigma E protease